MGEKHWKKLHEVADADIRRRHLARTPGPDAVHPGDLEAGLTGAEEIRYRGVAGVEDPRGLQLQAAHQVVEDGWVRLDGARLLRSDDGIEAEVVAPQGGGQKIVVGVGEDGETIAGAERLQHRVDLGKGGRGGELIAEVGGSGLGVATKLELLEDVLELDGPGLVVAAVDGLAVVLGAEVESGAKEAAPEVGGVGLQPLEGADLGEGDDEVRLHEVEQRAVAIEGDGLDACHGEFCRGWSRLPHTSQRAASLAW